MPLTVPIVKTANLPVGTCFDDPQTLMDLIVARIVGMFVNNLNGVIISATAPGVDDRDKLWFNTNNADNQIYSWVTSIGTWGRKHPFDAGSQKRIWFPLETDLITEDGGSAGAVGDATGPFWQRDTTFDGRLPLAKGTIPGTSPAVSVNDGDTVDSNGHAGEYEHTLTQAEGGLGAHMHFYGVKDPTASAAAFAASGSTPVTVPGYSSRYIGGNTPVDLPKTTADLQTLPPLDPATGTAPTQDPMILMPPFLCGIWAFRTARIWILPPP